MIDVEDFPCTGEPAVPSVATVIAMTPYNAERLEDGKRATAFIHRQTIDAVDFYNEKTGA